MIYQYFAINDKVSTEGFAKSKFEAMQKIRKKGNFKKEDITIIEAEE